MKLSDLFLGLLDAGVSEDLMFRVAQELAEKMTARINPTPDENVWVYVMAVDNDEEERVKVGISKHPGYRRHELEKERGLPLTVVHKVGPYTRQHALDIERRSHKRLVHMHELGEWFFGGASMAATVVQICAQEAMQ